MGKAFFLAGLLFLASCAQNDRTANSSFDGEYKGVITSTSNLDICTNAVVDMKITGGFFRGDVRRDNVDIITITPVLTFVGHIKSDDSLKIKVHPKSQVYGEAQARFVDGIIIGTWEDEYNCSGTLKIEPVS